MPPVAQDGTLKSQIENYIKTNTVMVFSKTTCPFCRKIKALFESLSIDYFALEVDQQENMTAYQDALLEMSGQRTVPNVYINGQHLGGFDSTLEAHTKNKLLQMINPPTDYDYDLVVIGGGSGGLSAAKEAALLGKKVACIDFVKPSPQGTTWGLGGTCVNVGCIPKKLMHQAAILGHSLHDARKFGWEFSEDVKHNWEVMTNAIQDHIGSLNWGYRVQLREKNVTYMNAYGEFIGPHKMKTTNKRGKVQEITSQYFIIATGGRPRYPDIPGLKEYAISSDDLFSLDYCPGKTLVIGASYVALECAGFLASLGLDTTVMVRSILLRGFDQSISEKIGDYMAAHDCKFVRPCVPTKVEKLEDGTPGKYRVTGRKNDGTEFVDDFNTVMVAVGRDPCTSGMGLETIGVVTNPKTGYLVTNDGDQTNVPHVYGLGDILEGKPELTPVAIQAGKLLTRRLFTGSTKNMDYQNVPTTVFTPLEYGTIGLAEEDAIAKYGEGDIEVFHQGLWPLEWTVAARENDACYLKLICRISDNMRVVGFHIVGPNCGEITQGFALGMKLGACKDDFDNTVGIHPTVAENFTTVTATKRSGMKVEASGC